MTTPDESRYLDHLQADPAICGGQVCIRGTRIPVSLLLDALAGGESIDDLLRGYPTLTRDDVAAALSYAARLARERILPLASTS